VLAVGAFGRPTRDPDDLIEELGVILEPPAAIQANEE